MLKYCLISKTIVNNFLKNYYQNPRTFKRTFISNFKDPNLKFSRFPSNSFKSKQIHISSINGDKIFVDYENNYMYSFLPKLQTDIIPVTVNKKITTENEFNELLERNWRLSKTSDIVQAFITLQEYCCRSNINLSDQKFDKLVDGLMDNCEKLTDSELLSLLNCLNKYPQCESITSHNFHDVWSCLDDVCCWKINNWKSANLFQFADAWCTWNLGKVSNFVYHVLNKLAEKSKNLDKDELVRVFFLMNIRRKNKVDFEYEYHVERKIKEMNTEELTIIALGFFKSQCKIKLKTILETMIDRIIENSRTIHDISLTALLKVYFLNQIS